VSTDSIKSETTDSSYNPTVSEPINFLERHNLSPVKFGLLSLVVVFLLYQIVGGSITFLLFGGKFRDGNIQWLRLSTVAAQLLLILLPALLLTRLQTSNLKERLRLRPTGLREVLFAVVGVVALQQVLQVYAYLQDQVPIPPTIRPTLEAIRKVIDETYKVLISAHSTSELLYVLIVVALVPAFCEEVLFRGLVQRNFEDGLKKWGAIILTGLIFGAYHFNPFSFVPLVVLGVYFGFLVFRSGSLLTSIAGHFANNLFAVLGVFYYGQDSMLVGDVSSGVSTEFLLLITVGCGGVFFLSTYAFVMLTRNQPEGVTE
jgi:membrane protease YdiL (CAAX protease family)